MNILATAPLTTQQQILRRRMDDEIAKTLLRRPANAQDVYQSRAARAGDWTIRLQPARSLPLALTQLIPLSLKNTGNMLFEETRALNNRHAGSSYRAIDVMLASDPEFLDLRARALAWGEDVARQVSFRLRHRALAHPYRTYVDAYRTLLPHMDTVMVHGDERMYSLVWAAVLDLLPYKLLESMVLAPGHLTISYEQDEQHLPYAVMTDSFKATSDVAWLTNIISLYCVEPAIYLDKIILSPLLAALQATPSLPPLPAQRTAIQEMVADVMEAFPYLVSSERAERYMFRIPGTSCVATFSFLASAGCAKFTFFDDEESMRRGVRTNFARAGLEIGYDGRFSSTMHPWRTLDTLFAPEHSSMLAYWLLKQVHGRLLADYLSIEHYYLHPSEEERGHEAAAFAHEETLLYVAWAKTAEHDEPAVPETQADNAGTEAWQGHGSIPQLRRRTFFKLLENCGVSVEQGKGSEIKLLRKSCHPFRLGNHYGSNPTVPAFLAAAILKRLEITRQEWVDAMAAH